MSEYESEPEGMDEGPPPPRQVITPETKIDSNNVGFGLLQKMGWTEGHGLGIEQQGKLTLLPHPIILCGLIT